MKSPLSTIILTYNSQGVIRRCLKSVSFCSEIIVIDNFSHDDTVAIAQKYGARVYSRHLKGNWSAQRNFALTKASNRWILFVDSDEYVTPPLRQEIVTALQRPAFHGYLLPREDMFMGKALKHGETSTVRLLRLADKKFGRWIRPVHEVWQIRKPIGRLHHPLIHRRNLTLTDFITRLDHYSSLEQFSFHWIDLLKPKAKFIVNYIFRLGFLDGFAGFTMAYLMSLHSLIVRVKTWENSHR